MAIEIKLLGREDTGVLAYIAPEVFDNPINVGRANEFLADPRHHLVVAVEDGLVVGFVSAVHYVHPDKPRSAAYGVGRSPGSWVRRGLGPDRPSESGG
jgi:hypothetical protein